MIIQPPFRQVAKVEMHLPGGFTRVVLRNFGGHWWDIPTNKIPTHLRTIGSELLITMPRFTPEQSDIPEAVRDMLEQVDIEELSAANRNDAA
jgi:hypothetical protein